MLDGGNDMADAVFQIRLRKASGLSLVIAGLLVAVFGFLSMGFYSPSLSEEEHTAIAMEGAIIGLVGVLMALFGWMLLKR